MLSDFRQISIEIGPKMLISMSRVRQNYSQTFLKITIYIYIIFCFYQFPLCSTIPHFSIISRLHPKPNPSHHLDLALKFPVWASIPENLGFRPQSCQIFWPMECIWSGKAGWSAWLECTWGHLGANCVQTPVFYRRKCCDRPFRRGETSLRSTVLDPCRQLFEGARLASTRGTLHQSLRQPARNPTVTHCRVPGGLS